MGSSGFSSRFDTDICIPVHVVYMADIRIPVHAVAQHIASSLASPLHAIASATIQEPNPFVRKRLRKETTVPHDDARTSGGPHLAATDTDRVMKRSLDDPYTSSAKPATNSV